MQGTSSRAAAGRSELLTSVGSAPCGWRRLFRPVKFGSLLFLGEEVKLLRDPGWRVPAVVLLHAAILPPGSRGAGWGGGGGAGGGRGEEDVVGWGCFAA